MYYRNAYTENKMLRPVKQMNFNSLVNNRQKLAVDTNRQFKIFNFYYKTKSLNNEQRPN